MAVAYVAADQQTASPLTAVSTGSDRIQLPYVTGRSSSILTITDITFGGVTTAGLVSAGVDGGTAGYMGYGHILDTNNTGSGSQAISDTWAEGTPTDRTFGVIELSGVDQTTPFGTPTTNTAIDQPDGTTVGVTLTGAAGEFALVYIVTGDGVASTVSGGHTLPGVATSIGELYNGRTHVHWGYISSVASSSETLNFTASVDGSANIDSISVGAFVVNAAGGGGGSSNGPTSGPLKGPLGGFI